MSQTPLLATGALPSIPITGTSIGVVPPAPLTGTTVQAIIDELVVLLSSAGQTPFHIPIGETYTVLTDKQVLWQHVITVDGTLVVDGVLLFAD